VTFGPVRVITAKFTLSVERSNWNPSSLPKISFHVRLKVLDEMTVNSNGAGEGFGVGVAEL
jgi:hypothetical protein